MAENNNILLKLDQVEARYHELESMMEDPDVVKNPDRIRDLAKEHSSLLPIINKAGTYRDTLRKIEEGTASVPRTSRKARPASRTCSST